MVNDSLTHLLTTSNQEMLAHLKRASLRWEIFNQPKRFLLQGACKDGWQCKPRVDCPRFLQEKAKLETLPFFSPQWGSLAKDLLGRKCSEEADGVCCRTEFEIVGGTVVEQVEDFPFVARIVFKTSFSTRGFCGASLIHRKLLLTAKHCVGPFFWEWCLDESDCYAYFRDLVPGRTNFEKGEFTIPLVDMFEREGTSDLAIVKLGFAVSRIKGHIIQKKHSGKREIRLALGIK